MDISNFLNKVNGFIINPLIVLLFAIAFVIFFLGILQFVNNVGESTERETGKKRIIYGLIGMFIMFSAFGLIRIVLGTFGINQPSYLNNRP